MAAPRITLIVAMSRNRVIGREGAIPWHLPAELRRFKALTMGHHIVMGRRTWDSIGRLLPGRTTVIVTRNAALQVPGALIAHSLQEAITLAAKDSQIFVIGGAEIFREALAHAHRIHLTTVDADVEGDTYMPELDLTGWRKVAVESHPAAEGNPLAWTLETYDRADGAGQAQ
jgi:dihydrofolate reductase